MFLKLFVEDDGEWQDAMTLKVIQINYMPCNVIINKLMKNISLNLAHYQL